MTRLPRRDASDPSSSHSVLALERLEMFEGEDRIWGEFERTRDAAMFGAQWARFSRASVFPSLASALQPAGEAARVQAFFDHLEAGVAARLAAAPARMTIPLAMMALSKNGCDARPRVSAFPQVTGKRGPPQLRSMRR